MPQRCDKGPRRGGGGVVATGNQALGGFSFPLSVVRKLLQTEVWSMCPMEAPLSLSPSLSVFLSLLRHRCKTWPPRTVESRVEGGHGKRTHARYGGDSRRGRRPRLAAQREKTSGGGAGGEEEEDDREAQGEEQRPLRFHRAENYRRPQLRRWVRRRPACGATVP